MKFTAVHHGAQEIVLSHCDFVTYCTVYKIDIVYVWQLFYTHNFCEFFGINIHITKMPTFNDALAGQPMTFQLSSRAVARPSNQSPPLQLLTAFSAAASRSAPRPLRLSQHAALWRPRLRQCRPRPKRPQQRCPQPPLSSTEYGIYRWGGVVIYIKYIYMYIP